MKRRPRIYYTEIQKALMWDRWQKGESLQQIAKLFDRNHSSIEWLLQAPPDFGTRLQIADFQTPLISLSAALAPAAGARISPGWRS